MTDNTALPPHDEPRSNEEIRVTVELTFSLDGRVSAPAQKADIERRVREHFSIDPEFIEYKIQRFQSEFDTYSNLIRDAAHRPIRIGDAVFHDREIFQVADISEDQGLLVLEGDSPERRSVSPKHCVVIL